MRNLVTGAAGFLGSRLVHALLSRGEGVRALDRSPDRAAFLKGQSVDVVVADLSDRSPLASALGGVRRVFHCASLVSDTASREEMFRANVEGLRTLLDLCSELPLEKFVHVSSLAVLGIEDHYGTEEEAPYRPSGDPYLDSKIEAERLALSYSRGRGVPVAVIRPGYIYGPGDRHFLPRILDTLKKGRMIYVDGGRKVLNVVFVENLVDALLLAAAAPGSAGRVFHVTDGVYPTRREFIEEICRLTGLKEPRVSIPAPLALFLADLSEGFSRISGGRVRFPLNRFRYKFLATNLDFDISRARRDLSYRPRVSWREGLRRTLEGGSPTGGTIALTGPEGR